LQVSKRTQHGLRAAVNLARRHAGGGYVQSRDLAEQEGLPTKFLEQVLLVLRRAGLLESKVGSGGGYRLRRDPGRITVRQLLDALEPAGDPPEPGPRTPGGVAVNIVLARLDEALADVADDWVLADLADEAARQSDEAGTMYYI
jgi:Rrf2 family protein